MKEGKWHYCRWKADKTTTTFRNKHSVRQLPTKRSVHNINLVLFKSFKMHFITAQNLKKRKKCVGKHVETLIRSNLAYNLRWSHVLRHWKIVLTQLKSMRLFIQNKPEDFLDGTKRTIESNFLIRKLTFRSVYVLPAREVAKQFTFFTNWKEVNMTQRLHLQLSPGGMDHFCSFAVLGHCTMHLLGQLKVFNKITSFSHFGE